MKQSEYLGVARDVVAHGWIQGVASDMNDNWCSYGALSKAAVDTGQFQRWYCPSCVLLDDMSKAQGFTSLMAFNDNPATTQQDVLDFFDKAIAGLEERGE